MSLRKRWDVKEGRLEIREVKQFRRKTRRKRERKKSKRKEGKKEKVKEKKESTYCRSYVG